MKSVVMLLAANLGTVKGVLFSLGKEDTFSSRAETTGAFGSSLDLMGADIRPIHKLELNDDESKPAAAINHPSAEHLDMVLDAIEENGIEDSFIVVFGNDEAYQINQDGTEVTSLGQSWGTGGLTAIKEVREFGFGYFDTNSDTYYMFENVHGTVEERREYYRNKEQQVQDDSDEEEIG